MLIYFLNREIETLCSQELKAKRKLGSKVAKKLQTRLADIEAAGCVSDLVAGKPHPLKGKRTGEFSLELHGGFRLVFEPANKPLPTINERSIDWKLVTEVRITFIGDYHD